MLKKKFMENKVLGIHHITAIAGDAQGNYDFYTQLLGLRMVKKTVNFDDPGTYHFYYGDTVGTPGSILTFFPWGNGVHKGRPGTGMATEIAYSVPKGSLDFWTERFKEYDVIHQPLAERFGEKFIQFQDRDGLILNLVTPSAVDERKPWTTDGVKENIATRGFHSIVLTVKDSAGTIKVLTDIFGYQLLSQEGNRFRFVTKASKTANIVDIVEDPKGGHGITGGGANHHVAFRVKNEEEQMSLREKILSAGHNITPKIDRNYFYSLYFREPGGVLFEIATDNPGFSVDEPLNELGTHLMLPAQFEGNRKKIQEELPKLHQ
jgi:glyoxalase family protein